jgi:hypothetical protein
MPERIFSFDEAAALIPEVKRLTAEAVRGVEALQGGDEESLPPEALEIVTRWGETLRDRGAIVKGLWLVDFDNGSGYYCWQYPEDRLEYFHTYDAGFRGRMRIH